MKYKEIDGIFFDIKALQRLGKKTSLSDSLLLINKLNNAIIKRNNESLSDCELTEVNFKNYVTSSKKEKELIVKKYDLKIIGKNILIGILSTGTTVLGLIVLLK